MIILLSNHFINRYRERILDMNPAMWKIWNKDYKTKLRATVSPILLNKAQKTKWTEFPKELQEYYSKKYNNYEILFKYSKTIYVGQYIKNNNAYKSDEECVLLLTCLRTDNVSKITDLFK